MTKRDKLLLLIALAIFLFVWKDIGITYALCVLIGMMIGGMLAMFSVK